jgi:hypothetical protein
MVIEAATEISDISLQIMHNKHYELELRDFTPSPFDSKRNDMF